MLKNYVKLIVALVFASNVMAQNIPSYVPTNGLVGYWPFNGNANDESGNGNNGTVNGATLTADRNGKANSAYSFDGKSYISMSAINELTTTSGSKISISFWFNSNSSIASDFFDLRSTNNSGSGAMWNYPSSNKVSFGNYNMPISAGKVNEAEQTISLNKWNFLVGIFDFTNNNCTIYVNGNLVTTKVYNQNIYGFLSNPKLTIGARNDYYNSISSFFTGLIDDFSIYNRELTQQEITALYTGTPVAQNIPSYVPTNGLVGYWPFNGNANDESGNGNDGVIGNGITPTNDRNNKPNNAYYFSGNGNINLKYFPIKNQTDFTFSVWLKSDRKFNLNGNRNGIFSIGSKTTDNAGVHLFYYNGFPAIDLSNKPGIGSSKYVSDDNWHNIIAVNSGGKFMLFVDGVSDGQFKLMNPDISEIDLKEFGSASACCWSDYFIGNLDDIAIYNRALTEQEITALYTGDTQSALASTKVYVDAPATVNQNQEVELSISTEALNTADNVIAYQTDFSYDTTRFTYVGSNLVGTLNPAGTVGINQSKNGLLQVGYMSQTALSGTGSLVKLKFKANNTTGQGIFGLANFMYNNTTITSLKSDTVTTLDVTPPTAKITYTQNPVRKGDSLLITVNFNEKMALSPVPQLNLTGQNTLSNTNLTKVNDTTYTFWWVVEKGNGAVNVTLATGKDVGGNAIVATPTQNASFTVLPTVFGDVDTNSFVRAYDAALALQYSVGLNPLPTMDPLPWSNWRIAVANVDTVGNVTANDASLILQKSIGQIATFPADAKKRGGETPTANVTVAQEGNQLVFRATGTLYACNVYMKDNFNVFGQPEVKDKNAMVASNITTTTYKVGLAATTPFVENEPFLVIPILTNDNVQGTLDIVVNAQEKSLSYGKAAGLTTIDQEAVIVYPNPTKDVVTISNAQGKTVRILDVQGKEVYNQKVNTSSMEVSMKGLGAKGMYLVHIVDANNESIQTKQIVLE